MSSEDQDVKWLAIMLVACVTVFVTGIAAVRWAEYAEAKAAMENGYVQQCEQCLSILARQEIKTKLRDGITWIDDGANNIKIQIGGDTNPELPPVELVPGNVVMDRDSRRKSVVQETRSLRDFEEYVCARPHEDGDLSYQCYEDWCRCWN